MSISQPLLLAYVFGPRLGQLGQLGQCDGSPIFSSLSPTPHQDPPIVDRQREANRD